MTATFKSDNFPYITDDTISQWVYNTPKYTKSGEINRNRRRVGYIVAGKSDEGVIMFGWSKCSKADDFKADLAREIAYGRLSTGTDTAMPATFKHFMPEFLHRCMKYFQVDKIAEFEFYAGPANWDQDHTWGSPRS